MATISNTPMILPKTAQEGLLQFHRQCYSLLNQQWNIREQMRNADLKYMREGDWTEEHQRAKISNKYGDTLRYQNMTVPLVKPLVEAAVTYQTSVFLTGNPIFGTVSAPPFEDEALQMESVIEEQSIRGGWVAELMGFFRDGFKYNLSAIEVDWFREVTAAMETDLSFSASQGKPKEVIWEGNKLKKWDLYNTFFDSRVSPILIPSKGEFVGRTEMYSRIALKSFIAGLPDKIIQNVIPAFESGLASAVGGMSTGGIESYYIPQLNPDALIQKNPRATTDWMSWAGMSGPNSGIQYKNMYEVTTLYARILPSDFNLRIPSANTPQIWKLIIVNHQVIIYAERQTNAHGLLPVLFGQPYEDGLAYQTKSLLNDVSGMQDLSSALTNSWIASRRRAISDRVLYDPSRVTSEAINSPNPAAKIPVRPSAYGKPLGEAVYQFPFRDDQTQITMAEVQQVQQFAYAITGQNQAKQGQFVKGNKTLHEYSDVMAHSNGNDQKTSLLYETQIFTPMKEILKINILQYQGGTSLFNRARKQVVKIDPVALRKAILNFHISDGLIPADKIISGDAWTTALQAIGSSATIGQVYNMAPMFSYLMKTQGADLTPFEKSPQQVAYETAVQQWQQVAIEAVKAGAKPENMPKQPLPADYGFNPQQQGSAAPAAASSATSAPATSQPAAPANSGVQNASPAS
jgi:hypothetical protein